MAASPSSPPTLSIPGAGGGLGDSLSDQSLIEEEMESLQKEQSIRIVPDGGSDSEQPDFGSPDHQAESEMQEQDGPLVIDNEPDFHGYTPMEQEMCRAKKRRVLVTQMDTDWELHYQACAAVRPEISNQAPPKAPTPGKIRVRKRSDLVAAPTDPLTNSPLVGAGGMGSLVEEAPPRGPGRPKKSATPGKKGAKKVAAPQPLVLVPPAPPPDPMDDFEKEVLPQQVMPPTPRSLPPVSPPMMSSPIPALASAATASPSSLKPRAFSGLVGGGAASPYPSTSPLAPPSSSKRAWKPGPQFFRPLAGGWKREVVYGRDPETGGWTEKPTSILYHAPKTPGLKAKVFKTIDELRTFIANSDLGLHHFSFRKDPMGASGDQEICHAVDEEVEIFPPTPSPLQQTPPPPPAQVKQMPPTEDARSPRPTPTASTPGPIGKLKLKMFSKMKEKNTLEGGRGGGGSGLSSPTGSAIGSSGGDQSPPALSIHEPPTSTGSTPTAGKQNNLPNVLPLQVPSLPRPASQRGSSNGGSGGKWENGKWKTGLAAGGKGGGGGGLVKAGGGRSNKPGSGGGGGGTGRAALRPNNMTRVNCSIHCQKAVGPPVLSCFSCNKLFHPVCVGLMEGPDYSGFDFYCADCPPPLGQETVEMPPPLEEMMDVDMDGAPLRVDHMSTMMGSSAMNKSLQNRAPSPKSPFTGNAKVKQRQRASLTKKATSQPLNAAANVAKVALKAAAATEAAKKAAAGAAAKSGATNQLPPPAPPDKPLPLRPIESQCVINIAGNKFLVVPHPTATNQNNATNQTAAKKVKVGKEKNRDGHHLLPLLLKPFEPGSGATTNGVPPLMPTFEVEQTPDGKMVLVPFGNEENNSGGADQLQSLFRKKPAKEREIVEKPSAAKVVAAKPLDINSLPNSYNALLSVFKYLPRQDLVRAGGVCKFWRQVSLHPSLWKVVSLKNVKVTSWPGLALALHSLPEVGVCLDFRKMVHLNPESTDETWAKVRDVAAVLANKVERIEVPKVSAAHLNSIVEQMATSPISRLSRVSAASLVTAKDPADLSILAKVQGLKELKVKSPSGHLSMTNFDSGLEEMLANSQDSLLKLSLVSLNCLNFKHLDIIANFKKLEVLELGDCTLLQGGGLFSKLIPLSGHLKELRLERSIIGSDIGTLEHFDKLVSLELIDVELKAGFGQGFIKLRKISKLMLIPTYRDEVATINSEIVDSVLSMAGLSFFVLGLTNEWLASMNALMSEDRPNSNNAKGRENFPILVNGGIELFSLQKLFKTLSAALPSAQVKILKMPATATTKQTIPSRSASAPAAPSNKPTLPGK